LTTPKKVLLVEDELVLRNLYCKILADGEGKGVFDVRTADSAESAMMMVERDNFEVVLTDYRLPGKDGVSLIRDIRRDHPSIRCLLISGFMDPGLVRAAIDAGACDTLKKPCSCKEILEAVKKAAESDSALFDREANMSAMVEASVLSSILIDTKCDIKCANKAFREEYGECVGRKCYEILSVSRNICPNCQAAAAVDAKRPKTVVRTARAPRGNACRVEERVEPWFDRNGEVQGLFVSIMPRQDV